MILNISVTTKFGIVFLLPPLITISLMLGGVHYFYGITPELFLDLIPALISTAAVLLLVWERLRESLIKDLKWFHDNVLFKLYSEFSPYRELYHIQPKGFKKLRADLEEYGQSMLLHLYPGDLPEMLDKFLGLNEDFSPKLEKIEDWATKELGSHYAFRKFLYYLGIESFHSYNSKPVEDAHRDGAQELKQKQPEVVNGAIDLFQKMGETRAQIYNSLDDFIKDNKLRLEAKPSYVGYPRY